MHASTQPTKELSKEHMNPALAPFDLTGYTGTRGWNFYEQTSSFVRILNKYSADCGSDHINAMHKHLSDFGNLAGGILNDLIMASHKEGKYGEVVQFDATGNRIDEVRYCEEQKQARKIAYDHGIVNLQYHKDWKYPFTFTHRMILACMSNMNGEGGVSCPLAMTDGLILALEQIGTEIQKSKHLKLLADPASKSHLMAGQYVTERVGGSNVAANRTVARKSPDGKWILNGEKWFCSNPGDLWVTTARIEDTAAIGMFLVARVKEDGSLNGSKILRKKDIIGSRGKITVEVVYENAEAEELGRPAHGLANMIKYIINTSRLHVGAGAVGHGRRSYLEISAYARKRTAYGKTILELPAVMATLAKIQTLQTTLEFAVFKNYNLNSKNHPASRLLTPLMKYSSTVLASWITHEAILILGGNGILGDFSILPRLHNDAIINETWEGTHPLLCEHALKAYSRPNIRQAFDKTIDENLSIANNARERLAGCFEVVSAMQKKVQSYSKKSDFWIDSNRLAFCDALYSLFALTEMMRETGEAPKNSPYEDGLLTRAYAELAASNTTGPVFSDEQLVRKLAGA